MSCELVGCGLVSMDDEIIVNREMLKAVGADTRIAILKSLRERQKTQSEIAEELKLSAPTVLEHIHQLEKAKLIELVLQDKERKWKYYCLTKVGRKMVEGSKMNVMVVLSASLLLALGVLYFFLFLSPVSNIAASAQNDHEYSPILKAIQESASSSTGSEPDIVSKCTSSGGAWKTLANSCVDNCGVTAETICAQTLTEGCDCGESKCWNGEKERCVPNQ